MSRTSHLQIGIAAIGFSVFLFLVGIPYGVTAPSNIRNIVLSPVFWPMIVAGLLALGGIGMVLAARRLDNQNHEGFLAGIDGAAGRLCLAALLMLAYVAATPIVGMVWTSMAAFILLALLIRTRHRLHAGIAAIVVPLVLYAFFAHVAGVAIPQGEFVRLP